MGPPWLAAIRKAAIARFAETGFPTTDEEEWRFTNVAPIASARFRPAAEADARRPSARDIAAHGFEGAAVAQLVIVNGRAVPELSTLGDARGSLALDSLAALLAKEPGALEAHLARHAEHTKHPFTALNTALLHDGAVIRVADRAVIERPVHVLYVTTADAGSIVTHPRTLLIAGRDSQATVIESHVGLGEDVTFTNAVTEVVLGEGAVVEMIRIEQESRAAYHVANVSSHQLRASSLAFHSISLGAAIARNDVRAVLAAEGAECILNGLYVADGKQLVDNHTVIDHAMPHCASRELYKGILDGQARSVFNGRIIVRKDAQKTDSKQTNRNLLLSEEATVYTNPQLEIYADDVRCTHGATIGQLDEEAMFYMRSRGIAADVAARLLIYAFASEILDRMKFETARVRLERALFTRLAGEQPEGSPV
jgi:Fe-S cluster assembly protein SufD